MWRMMTSPFASLCLVAILAVTVAGHDTYDEPGIDSDLIDFSRMLADVSDMNMTNMSNVTETTTMTTTTTTMTTTTMTTTTTTMTTTMTTTEASVTTSVNIGLVLEDATTFDEETFKRELAAAAGVSVDDIVITSTTFTVEVAYSFSGIVDDDAVVASVLGIANNVDPSTVSVQLSTSSGRRLATSIMAVFTAADAAATNSIKTTAANTDVIGNAINEATGESFTLSVTSAPQAKVLLMTEVTQPASTAASTPITSENIAAVGTALGGTISVIDPNDPDPTADGMADGADGADGMADGTEPSAATRAGSSLLAVLTVVTGLAMKTKD